MSGGSRRTIDDAWRELEPLVGMGRDIALWRSWGKWTAGIGRQGAYAAAPSLAQPVAHGASPAEALDALAARLRGDALTRP